MVIPILLPIDRFHGGLLWSKYRDFMVDFHGGWIVTEWAFFMRLCESIMWQNRCHVVTGGGPVVIISMGAISTVPT